jgi:hypothetical protein
LRLGLILKELPVKMEMTLSRWSPTMAALFTVFVFASPVDAGQQAEAVTPSKALQNAPTIEQTASSSGTQAAEQKRDPDLEELRRRLDLLAAEVETLRSGETERTPLTASQTRRLGLGPSAASVYERKAGVSVAGYGEMLYENFDSTDEGAGSRIDFLRAVLYTGYRFNERFVFNSEIEFEHGGEEVGVEFAYLDYRVRDHLSLRGGMLLVPLGLVNEFHEPNVFIGARRPQTEQQLIPSTWHENGFGVVGSSGIVSYRAYVVDGFDANGFSASGLRGGRQEGIEAKASDWGVAGRLDVNPVPGVLVGTGLYRGNSGQDQFGTSDIGTTIVELHGQAQIRGVDVRGLFARADVADAAALNAALSLAGAQSVGKTLQGGYAQVGYNVLSQGAGRVSVTPYYRFEQLDTQKDVPAGFLRDAANDVRYHTIGVEVKPIANIVLKADYQKSSPTAAAGRHQFNVSLGYAF